MQILTIILLSLMGVLAIIGAILGYKRGLARQIIRTITVILSALVSIYLAKLLVTAIMVWIENRTAEELIIFIKTIVPVSIESYEPILTYLDTGTLNYILAIPLALVIAPVTFILAFLLVKLIMMIPHVIIAGLMGFSKKKNTATTRLLGMFLGALQGIFVAIMIIYPLAGASVTSTEIITEMNEQAPEDETTVTITEFYNTTIKTYVEDPVVKLVGDLGGKQLYNNLATVNVRGVDYEMVETLAEPTLKIGMSVNKLKGWDWKAPTPENEDAVKAIIEAVDDSEYARNLISDILVFVSQAYADGAITIDMEQPLSEIVAATFEAIGGITANTLGTDLETLAEAYFILARENIIYALEAGNAEEIRDLLTKTIENEDGTSTTVIAKVTETLNENPNTTPLVTVLTKLSLAALSDQLGADVDLDALYGSVKNGVSDTLAITKEDKTKEEYIEAVSESLDNTLTGNGIELEKDILDEMANYVYDNYDELNKVDSDHDGEISDYEVNKIVLSYYDAYMKSLEGGGEIDLPDDVPSIPDLLPQETPEM